MTMSYSASVSIGTRSPSNTTTFSDVLTATRTISFSRVGSSRTTTDTVNQTASRGTLTLTKTIAVSTSSEITISPRQLSRSTSSTVSVSSTITVATHQSSESRTLTVTETETGLSRTKTLLVLPPDASVVISSDFSIRVSGSNWPEVLQKNYTAAVEIAQGMLVESVGVPREFIVINSLRIGSLIIDFTVKRNGTFSIPDKVISGILQSELNMTQLIQIYKQITNSTENISLSDVVITRAASSESASSSGGSSCTTACIAGVAVGVSVAVLGAVVCGMVCVNRRRQRAQKSSMHSPTSSSWYFHDGGTTTAEPDEAYDHEAQRQASKQKQKRRWLAKKIDWSKVVVAPPHLNATRVIATPSPSPSPDPHRANSPSVSGRRKEAVSMAPFGSQTSDCSAEHHEPYVNESTQSRRLRHSSSQPQRREEPSSKFAVACLFNPHEPSMVEVMSIGDSSSSGTRTPQPPQLHQHRQTKKVKDPTSVNPFYFDGVDDDSAVDGMKAYFVATPLDGEDDVSVDGELLLEKPTATAVPPPPAVIALPAIRRPPVIEDMVFFDIGTPRGTETSSSASDVADDTTRQNATVGANEHRRVPLNFSRRIVAAPRIALPSETRAPTDRFRPAKILPVRRPTEPFSELQDETFNRFKPAAGGRHDRVQAAVVNVEIPEPPRSRFQVPRPAQPSLRQPPTSSRLAIHRNPLTAVEGWQSSGSSQTASSTSTVMVAMPQEGGAALVDPSSRGIGADVASSSVRIDVMSPSAFLVFDVESEEIESNNDD